MLSNQTRREAINNFALRYAALLGRDKPLASPICVFAALTVLLPVMDQHVFLETCRALGLAPEAVAQMPSDGGNTVSGALFVQKQLFGAVVVGPDAPIGPLFPLDGASFDMRPVDFSDPVAPEELNAWIAEKTSGKLTHVVSEFPPATYVAVVTALYYAGAWATPFGTTEEGAFFGDHSETVANFMVQDEALYAENEDCKAVLLPTENNGGLCVFLAKDPSIQTPVFPRTDAALQALDWQRRQGCLKLPRFRAEVGGNCVETLKDLGLRQVFETANPLSGLFSSGVPARLETVLQNAVLRIDEHGVEAAAAVVMTTQGALPSEPSEPFEMICNRPFSYLLFDRTEDFRSRILFVGAVFDV